MLLIIILLKCGAATPKAQLQYNCSQDRETAVVSDWITSVSRMTF